MSIIKIKPPLSPEERNIPYSKYYNLELEGPDQFARQILSKGPMDPADAVPVERRFDSIDPEAYLDVELGYCLMPDGSGYVTAYDYLPNIHPNMIDWWFRWFNVKTANMPEGRGNLRYKIWCPPDHFDHGNVNPDNPDDGTVMHESLDLGAGMSKLRSMRLPIYPSLTTLPPEKAAAMKKAGCSYGFSALTTEGLTSRISCRVVRPRGGGAEVFNRIWYGYAVRGGKIVRDLNGVQADEERMRIIAIHNIVEVRHLAKLLPPLYAEYGAKPFDEDF